ncbi:MAG TPA: GNAT family N-acetyltransferase [Candidatus Limnocylindrales bacterium]|nr:GNAT family N-acetyltransferase [Candidatus Limnocylindrales bacterium]
MDRYAAFPSVPVLETPRLVLRGLTLDDAPWYLRHFSTPEIVSGQGYAAPVDLAAAEAELRRFVLDLFAVRAGFRWGIATRDDPALIGSAGLYRWVDTPTPQAELGYDLDPSAWGRGYMHEALGAILGLAFGRMGLERVEAFVLATNDRSQRVLERLGFLREALLPEHGEDEHGVLRDELRFGIARGAWHRRGGRP